MNGDDKERPPSWWWGLILGAGIGAAFGVALDNISVGIGLGAGIGIAFALRRR